MLHLRSEESMGGSWGRDQQSGLARSRASSREHQSWEEPGTLRGCPANVTGDPELDKDLKNPRRP